MTRFFLLIPRGDGAASIKRSNPYGQPPHGNFFRKIPGGERFIIRGERSRPSELGRLCFPGDDGKMERPVPMTINDRSVQRSSYEGQPHGQKRAGKYPAGIGPGIFPSVSVPSFSIRGDILLSSFWRDPGARGIQRLRRSMGRRNVIVPVCRMCFSAFRHPE